MNKKVGAQQGSKRSEHWQVAPIPPSDDLGRDDAEEGKRKNQVEKCRRRCADSGRHQDTGPSGDPQHRQASQRTALKRHAARPVRKSRSTETRQPSPRQSRMRAIAQYRGHGVSQTVRTVVGPLLGHVLGLRPGPGSSTSCPAGVRGSAGIARGRGAGCLTAACPRSGITRRPALSRPRGKTARYVRSFPAPSSRPARADQGRACRRRCCFGALALRARRFAAGRPRADDGPGLGRPRGPLG